jgi:predicted nucleic acid-binding protein
MSVEFIDTNIVVYAYAGGQGERPDKSRWLIEQLATNGCGAISIQILTEFYSVSTGKLGMASRRAEEIILSFGHWKLYRPAHSDILSAIRLQRGHKLAWWDALVLNSAIELGATTLWTEDFTHGRKFGALTIRNPFHRD